MKQHMQTVINVCLAIGFTLLIYQNIQLKDDMESLDLYSRIDVTQTAEDIYRIDEDLRSLANLIDKNEINIDNIIETVNDHANGLNVANNNIDQLIKFNDSIYGNRNN
tara:strand:+ start:1557 stop:1880 length:324 start_codon:yes stop_codon:yes gene_type:complete